MANFTFATLRLGKTSVEEIKSINSKSSGAASKPFSISVVCTQVPTDLNTGVIVFIWLGSDNSKGLATEWKQGFKAIGRVTSIQRGEKYNDESKTDVEVFYVFPTAINRLDILRDAAADYYRCSSMPIIGLDDHSNQTIRMLESGELSDVNAFFSALNCVYGNFKDELVSIESEFSELFVKGDGQVMDNETEFRVWLVGQVKANGEPYSKNTRSQYISAVKAIPDAYAVEIAPYKSIFHINDTATLDSIVAVIKADVSYDSFNRSHSNGSPSACLELYRKFLAEQAAKRNTSSGTESDPMIRFNTGIDCEFQRNRILFGAPGTGKSYTLNREKEALLRNGGEYERVTFHPDYSYANFVGTYKPVPCKDADGNDVITYAYVPGPFMRTYVKALQNSRTRDPKPYLLVIEEINRANVAAVFGDVFQLLDRGDDEASEYPIQPSEDIKKFLALPENLGGSPSDYSELRIPDNMFIWATMNSADQGVFPMDTAFKRRWDFTYLGIDDSEAGIVGKKVILGQGDYHRIVEWNALRKAINNELLTYKVNEDKLMGPYFISKKNLPEGEMIDPVVFTRIFKNKVIMYLFDDAAKQKRITLFGGCDEKAKNQYSKICREFDTKGVYIFCEGISSQFIDNVPEDDGE